MRTTQRAPTTSLIAYWVGRAWFGLFGWAAEGRAPDTTHAVVIAAPHTTNWDLPLMLAASFVLRYRISWLGKHTLFRGLAGPFFRWLGGVPVDRSAPGGLVAQAANRLGEAEALCLAVPPSGTRRRSEHWKSGFYWIAHTAGVPIVCGYLDFPRKRAGLGLVLQPTGDVRADMDKIRAFYDGIHGKYPAFETPVRLRDEERPPPLKDPENTRPAEHESGT
jgi:1-acyl-sn-glycerol-3-phosphate acyltransferase